MSSVGFHLASGTASPFRNNKKTRKRHRRRAKQQVAWADEQEAACGKPAWAVASMRWLASFNTKLAQSRRRKSS
jgi:hypothetical protein